MTGPDSVLARRDDLVVEHFPADILVWDQAAQTLHHLDAMAAIVWDELDGRPLRAIAADLASDFAAENAQLLADLITLCDDFVGKGLAVRRSA